MQKRIAALKYDESPVKLFADNEDTTEHRGGVLLWVTTYRPHLLVFNAQPQPTGSLQLQVRYFLNRPCIFNINNDCLKIHITIL